MGAMSVDFRARPIEALCDEMDNCDLPRPRHSHVEEYRRTEAEAGGHGVSRLLGRNNPSSRVATR